MRKLVSENKTGGVWGIKGKVVSGIHMHTHTPEYISTHTCICAHIHVHVHTHTNRKVNGVFTALVLEARCMDCLGKNIPLITHWGSNGLPTLLPISERQQWRTTWAGARLVWGCQFCLGLYLSTLQSCQGTFKWSGPWSIKPKSRCSAHNLQSFF